jgi:CheY-like chemotaxis protein
MANHVLLYVEDEENDIVLVRFGLKQIGVTHPLQVVTDGMSAVDYLSGAGSFADRESYPFPSLVLLDLNLPRFSGIEVLEWIRRQPRCKDLPVIIFTSSDNDGDRERARELGANEYFVKPGSLLKLKDVLSEIRARWLPGDVSSV